ncbi:hypothetical protein PYW07_013108 [Mythimna separata]|uniref:Uncharacterized protein n=1 Tax=Mythimna separata TaxID=271217 RepID=A0AAD7Y5X1_MYTSE|nr:hypothetical protein PYW07_013108 [Mythimna separata]
MDSMLRHTFVPDYSVRAITELFYLTVKRLADGELWVALQNINMDSMLRHTFVPDYSVRAITELFYLTVKRSLHLAAKRATLMEKGALSKGATNEQFDTEVDKLLQSVDEDISISGEQKTPSRQVSPHPLPVSASPYTLSSFASRSAGEGRNGDVFARPDEQEKLLK